MKMMNKPWEIKISNQRTNNTIYTFHLFCEDRNSEPLYFEQFNSSKVKIICHREQKSMFRNYVKAIKKCTEEGFIKKHESGFKVVREGMEVWCVFDRDKGSQGEDIDEGDITFDHVISNSTGVNIAWSNDAFELWILLHLMDIPDEEFENAKNREYYYQKLEDYLKNHQSPNEFLLKALSHNTFNYDDIKKGRVFPKVILPEIKPNTQIAIERAKKLFQKFENENDYSKKTPCSVIYKLVERIIEEENNSL